jgi:hypothetical protein
MVQGVSVALSRLATAGWRLASGHLQSAGPPPRGLSRSPNWRRVQARVRELLAAEDVRFDYFRVCLHDPAGVVAELTGEC